MGLSLAQVLVILRDRLKISPPRIINNFYRHKYFYVSIFMSRWPKFYTN
jgi:hypothetical protein